MPSNLRELESLDKSQIFPVRFYTSLLRTSLICMFYSGIKFFDNEFIERNLFVPSSEFFPNLVNEQMAFAKVGFVTPLPHVSFPFNINNKYDQYQRSIS